MKTKLKRSISVLISMVMVASIIICVPIQSLIASAYNSNAAISYADTYWSNYNPNYSNYNSIGGDCANFVSQCLRADGLEMDSGWYWYSYSNRSASWASCPSMYTYFKNKGYTIIENPSDSQVKEGNPVLYYSSSKGRWSHAAICTGHDSSGNALVSAHNNDRHNVNWKLGTSWSKRCTIVINGDPPPPSPTLETPTISTDKSSYINGETVNISWTPSPSGSNLSHYWLNVIAPDGIWIYGGTMNKDTSYSFVAQQSGNYTVTTYATPIGSKEGEGSLTDTKYIAVADAVPKGYEMSEGAGQTIPNGDYWISSAINSNYWLDIPGDEISIEGANIHMWTRDSEVMPGQYDVFTFIYLGNGFYKIKQKDSNLCLDVAGASLERGTNVQLWSDNGNAAQQWSVIITPTGYRLQSRCNSYFLDVAGADYANQTNIQVWESNDSNAQRFGLIPYSPNIGQTLDDGVYRIKSAVDNSYCLDASGTAQEQIYKCETNVQLWGSDGDDLFEVKYVENGLYEISEVSTGLVLDIYNGDTAKYLEANNIHLDNSSGKREHRWMLKDNGDGTYNVISQLSGYCMDVNGGKCENGINISQYIYNGTNAQKWVFTPVAPTELVIESVPNKTIYYLNDSIDMTGFDAYVKFSYGTFMYVSEMVDISYDFSNYGTSVVSVSFNESGVKLIDEFNVNIVKNYLIGDCNADGEFTIADAVMLQQWLLAVPDIKLTDWKAADIYEDNIINVFDMVKMRKLLIANK